MFFHKVEGWLLKRRYERRTTLMIQLHTGYQTKVHVDVEDQENDFLKVLLPLFIHPRYMNPA